jgi:ribosomal protein S18 acetylase RimI-like enzyme
MYRTTPVRPEDEPFLCTVYADTRRAEVAAWGWPSAQQDGFLQMQFQFQRRSYAMQFPNADHRIIWHEGEPVGQVLVDRTPDAIRLVDITILAAFRGRGMGSDLIRSLQAEALQVEKPLHLTVRKENPGARRLYERLGFTTVAETELDSALQWFPETRPQSAP